MQKTMPRPPPHEELRKIHLPLLTWQGACTDSGTVSGKAARQTLSEMRVRKAVAGQNAVLRCNIFFAS